MKILLVYPGVRKEVIDYGVLAWFCEPLALEYLTAGAKQTGSHHQIKVLDLRLHPNDLDSTLTEYQPDLVGVSGYSMDVLNMLVIFRRVKELLPNCFTVAGGQHATVLPEDFFEPEVDFVVTGEGVSPFRDILQRLENGERNLEGIPGTWTRVNGEFKQGPERYLYEIDDMPFPDREINLPDRPAFFMDDMRPIALIRTTEGCAFRCSFCSLWTIMDGRYLVRNNNRVVEELRQIKEECIHIVDDEPWLKISRMVELAKAIKEAGIKKRYLTYCRVDTMLRRPELMAAWREIGLSTVLMGVEAFTGKELDEYNKRVELHQIEQAYKAAENQGIKVISLLIVNTSYTKKDFKQLGRFIERLNVKYPGFTIWTPLPGTEALKNFDLVTEFQPNGRPNWELFDLQHPVSKTVLPREEFIQEFENFRKTYGNNFSQERNYSLSLVSNL